MILITNLIWDDWNRNHLSQHGVTPEEVEEVCHSDYQVVESYRKRIVVIENTKGERRLIIVLSPEDRDLQPYEIGVYYVTHLTQ